MTPVSIILAPFHGGVRGDRVGQGPLCLMEMGLTARIHATGAAVTIHDLGEVGECEGEIGRSFEVKRRIAESVAQAVSTGRFPLVLSGNCNASVGTYAGLGSPDTEVVWFDAHADLHTPDDLEGGYFDSMGAATLLGQCWQSLAATISGFDPLPPERLIYCGSRSAAASVWERMSSLDIRVVKGGADRPSSFAGALKALLSSGSSSSMLHLDMDCIDNSEGCANEYAEPGGLSHMDLLECLDVVLTASRPLALTVASFDPSCTGSARIGEVALDAVERVVWALR